MTNHYETLGLKPTASQEEIQSAYRKLSKKFHPDNNGGDEFFSELFKNIEESYNVLVDNNKKAKYDDHKQIIETDLIEVKQNSTDLEILFFESNKDTFIEGDTIELTWETKNADKVFIKPFGELKLKNFNKPELEIKLTAINSLSEKEVTKTVRLKNKVTEVDFSQFEEEETQSDNVQKEPVQEPMIEEEPIHSNSLLGTMHAEKEDTAVVKSEESFFSISGRLRRRSYLGRAILLGIPAGIASVIIQDTYDDTVIGWSAIVMIICSVLIFIQFIKRLHDINLSGWFSLINFIPYIGALFSLIVIFIDSSKGPNNYGADPKNRM
jgi:curved DNA-binding protein CbpA/uncharacterized membrane protein YhaH (DUF805 family)